MKNLSLIFLLFALHSCTSPEAPTTEANTDSVRFYSLEDFKHVAKTDAHVHVQTHDSAFISQAIEDNMKLFTINYDDANEPPPMEVQEKYAISLRSTFPGQIEWATTVSIRKFNDKNWLPQTLRYIDSTVKRGAKAVKIYKVIGMTLRDTKGKLVMVDDARLDSLFSYFESNGIPVVGHLGEPRNCWLPLDSMTVKGDASYFSQYPVYHMYKHPELPSYEDQIRARDNRLAKNPKLKFVGAHLGSLEWNVDSLAARLDKYPNFAVDMAARIVHLEVQAAKNPQRVRDFIIKYHNRLLYATDLFVDEKVKPADARGSSHDRWFSDWKFFATDEKMTSQDFDAEFVGLKLPKEIIDDIYKKNAEEWLGIF